MTPAHDETYARERIFVKRDAARVDVRLKVIDRNERFIRRDAERFRRRKTYKKRPREPWFVHHRDRAKIVKPDLRLVERLRDDGKNRLHMRSRRYFRNDSPVKLMHVDLRRQGRAQNVAVLVDDRRRCFIATRFYRKYFHR